MQLELPSGCNVLINDNTLRNYNGSSATGAYTDYIIFSNRLYKNRTGVNNYSTDYVCLDKDLITATEWEWQIPCVCILTIAIIWYVIYKILFGRILK